MLLSSQHAVPSSQDRAAYASRAQDVIDLSQRPDFPAFYAARSAGERSRAKADWSVRRQTRATPHRDPVTLDPAEQALRAHPRSRAASVIVLLEERANTIASRFNSSENRFEY